MRLHAEGHWKRHSSEDEFSHTLTPPPRLNTHLPSPFSLPLLSLVLWKQHLLLSLCSAAALRCSARSCVAEPPREPHWSTEQTHWDIIMAEAIKENSVWYPAFEKLKKVRNEASSISFYFIHPVFTVVVSRLISQNPNKAAISCASMHSLWLYTLC